MAVKKQKYYVVWVGQEPGIYDRWSDCYQQVANYPGARYKSFPTREDAVEAYRGDPAEHMNLMRGIARRRHEAAVSSPPDVQASMPAPRDYTTLPGIRLDAIAVDGACAGNPGKMEYRAVRVADGSEVFHIGVSRTLLGTNNIAEYLAMIHLAAILHKNGDHTTPIYTDSKNTLAWLRKGHSKTTLQLNSSTAATLDLLERADAWLALYGPIKNPILKWPTEEWGEIPADFGRK